MYIAHSLRPETMKGHDTLYKSVLHCNDNTLPTWFIEVVGVYTSLINECEYAITHHSENVKNLINNEERYKKIYYALSIFKPEKAFKGKWLSFLKYTEKFTKTPNKISMYDIDYMKSEGANDGEILEVNQTCAYFNYANRLINGLGIELGNDIIGYY